MSARDELQDVHAENGTYSQLEAKFDLCDFIIEIRTCLMAWGQLGS